MIRDSFAYERKWPERWQSQAQSKGTQTNGMNFYHVALRPFLMLKKHPKTLKNLHFCLTVGSLLLQTGEAILWQHLIL